MRYRASLTSPSTNESLSSTTSTVSTPAVSSRIWPVSSGQGIPSCTTRSPRASRSASPSPRSSSARSTAWWATPAATMASRGCAGSKTIRFRPATRAYWRARSRRWVIRSCSAARFDGGSSTGGSKPERGGSSGRPASAAATSTVALASAMSATIFSDAQRPLCRDSATACRPNPTSSDTDPGASTGSIRLRHSGSHELGTVEDLAAGSSPISATAPPSGAVPDRLPWRIASAARSRPGLLPYQKPVTPSWRRPSSVPSSWVPATAVAASSSFTPGWKTIPAGSVCSAARASSLSSPPSGEPW